MRRRVSHTQVSSPAKARSSIPETARGYGEAAAYWMPRSNRGMTAVNTQHQNARVTSTISLDNSHSLSRHEPTNMARSRMIKSCRCDKTSVDGAVSHLDESTGVGP